VARAAEAAEGREGLGRLETVGVVENDHDRSLSAGGPFSEGGGDPADPGRRWELERRGEGQTQVFRQQDGVLVPRLKGQPRHVHGVPQARGPRREQGRLPVAGPGRYQSRAPTERPVEATMEPRERDRVRERRGRRQPRRQADLLIARILETPAAHLRKHSGVPRLDSPG
jgi:hypothetical protein